MNLGNQPLRVRLGMLLNQSAKYDESKAEMEALLGEELNGTFQREDEIQDTGVERDENVGGGGSQSECQGFAACAQETQRLAGRPRLRAAARPDRIGVGRTGEYGRGSQRRDAVDQQAGGYADAGFIDGVPGGADGVRDTRRQGQGQGTGG